MPPSHTLDVCLSTQTPNLEGSGHWHMFNVLERYEVEKVEILRLLWMKCSDNVSNFF